jgi:hypothetical protein
LVVLVTQVQQLILILQVALTAAAAPLLGWQQQQRLP